VSVPDANNLDNTSALTIAFWVKPTILDGSPRGIVSKRTASGTQDAYSVFFYTGNKMYVDIDTGNNRFSTNTVFLTNTWYHVAVTYDGTLAPASRVHVYVNGVLDTTASETSASIPNYASSLTLGQLGGNPTSYFAGSLDDVRIYNRALSAAEVLGVYTPSPSPGVAYWKFDEGSGTTAADSSGSGNTGTVNGPTWTSGEIGGALNFDGVNDYVSVPDAGNLDNTSALTIAFWVKPTILDGSPRGIVSKRTASGSQDAYSIFFNSGNQIHVDIDTGNNRFSTNTVFLTNTWYHVAVTYDGTLAPASRVHVYVNGVLDKTAGETSASIPNYASDLAFGKLVGNPTSYFAGSLDDVRIYNRALTATEVGSLFNSR
jgi:hypothetical protein